jgi:diguanylate cyclase (GGDEF)-like protein/PAS domain S-box-containing protein
VLLIPSIKQLRSYLLPIIIILAGAALSAIAFYMTKEMDRQKIRMEFDQAAEDRYVAFKREIESNLQVLVAIQAFYSVSKKEAQLAEFQVFTKPFLLQNKSIQALEWIPRIPDSQREVYERRARRGGFPGFQITERKIQGEIVRAATRAEYFPVYYVEPYRGNELALGFDLASNPTRKEALERSRDTGDILATARITLVQERTSQFGIIVFAPVYRKGAPADSVQKRHENLEGFALGVFRIWDILEKSLTYLAPVSLDIYLYDRSAPEKESLLYYNPSITRKTKNLPTDDQEAGLEARLEYAKTLNVAGREWLVLCRATPDFRETRRSGWPSAVLTGGLLFTCLLAGYLLTYIRRTKRIEGLVNERTNELTERKRAEVALQMSETRYRRLFESARDGILILDADTGRVIDANPFMQDLLDYSCEEFLGKSLWDIGSFKDIAASKSSFDELQSKGYVRYEDLPLETSDGRRINVEFVSNVYIVDSKRVIQCNIRDITERKKMEEKLITLSITDPPTGLYNRRGFIMFAEQQLKLSDRTKRGMLLFFTDLDGMKWINDTLGHEVGDRALMEVADVLKETFRSSDIIARMGGDEFAILAIDYTDINSEIITRRLQNLIDMHNNQENRKYRLSVSVGCSFYDPENPCSIDELMAEADKLMYEHKRSKKSCSIQQIHAVG